MSVCHNDVIKNIYYLCVREREGGRDQMLTPPIMISHDLCSSHF